ncbi:MAG: hypothetical protein PV344_04455 [Anaplasma sp.]|nr:hypothetical protein [Anaplasma sp.]
MDLFFVKNRSSRKFSRLQYLLITRVLKVIEKCTKVQSTINKSILVCTSDT